MGASGSIQPFVVGDEVVLAEGIDGENGVAAGEYVTVTVVPDTKPGSSNVYKVQRVSDGQAIKGTFRPDQLARALPPKADLDTCRHFAGERFDQLAFNHFQDGDGMVTREQMLDTAAKERASLIELAADSRSRGKHQGSGCHRVGVGLKYASAAMRADREVVIGAVHQAGLALEFASPELRADKDVVLVAMRQNLRALKFASDELKTDQDVATLILEGDPALLKYVDRAVFEDREFIKECLASTWQVLEYAPMEVRHDKDLVMIAVRQNHSALQWASEDIRSEMGVDA